MSRVSSQQAGAVAARARRDFSLPKIFRAGIPESAESGLSAIDLDLYGLISLPCRILGPRVIGKEA